MKNKTSKKKTDNEWTSIFIGIIIPTFTTAVFRFGLFPNNPIDTWASAALLISLVLFIVGRYTPMKSLDIILVALVNIVVIACYLLYFIFGCFA